MTPTTETVELFEVNGLCKFLVCLCLTNAGMLRELEVDRERVTMLREIGNGNFSNVMEASVVGSDGESVIMAAKVALLQVDDGDRNQLFDEAVRQRGLSHDNVVRLLGVCFTGTPCFLLLEYMANGDLKAYLRQCESGTCQLTAEHLAKLAVDCCAGFSYLQLCKFVHRDLAARNVVLSGSYVAKIGDFGMSRALSSADYYRQNTQATNWALPIRWMAPESYLDGTWNLQTDVWMFGVLLWEIFSLGKHPWHKLADGSVMQAIQQRSKLERPSNCPSELYDVMMDCWKIDASKRAKAADIDRRVLTYQRTLSQAVLAWPVADIGHKQDVTDGMAIDIDSDARLAAFKELEVDRSLVSLGRVLGSGAFGEVRLGSLLQAGTTVDVAIKTLKDAGGHEESSKFLVEARILSALSHPNIVTLLAVCAEASPLLMVIELMPGGDLLKLLRSSGEDMEPDELVSIIEQIAAAMAHLEKHRIVHRDLAARNVLVQSSRPVAVKLSDVGLARTLVGSPYYKKSSNDKVPIRWMAPEAVLERRYTSKSDVWSYGVLCWEVFSCGDKPYSGVQPTMMMVEIIKGYRLPRPSHCSADL